MQIGDDITDYHKGIVKKPFGLKIKLRNRDGQPVRVGHDHVSVIVTPQGEFAQDDVKQQITTSDNHNGTFDIIWIPNYIGAYNMTIHVNDEQITVFNMTIENDPNKYHVASVRERSFEIQACDTEGEVIDTLEGREHFLVKFYDQSDMVIPTNHVMTNVKYVGQGKFFVSYIVIKPGDYTMIVTLGDQTVAQVTIRA
jgi:hypothetical protein